MSERPEMEKYEERLALRGLCVAPLGGGEEAVGLRISSVIAHPERFRRQREGAGLDGEAMRRHSSHLVGIDSLGALGRDEQKSDSKA